MLYKNAYRKRKTNAKDKDFIFLDSENVGEATWSKHSKCESLTFKALFSRRQSNINSLSIKVA